MYYVRHGESEFNKAGKWSGSIDTPLTQTGHQQAKQAGRSAKVAGLQFDLIISSPLDRAHQTAKHIADVVDYPVNKILIHPQLVERNFGTLEGRRNFAASAKYIVNESAIDSYGGESLVAMQQRADELLEYLRTLPHDTILVVGHGAFGRALRRAINKEPVSKRGASYDNAKMVRLV